MALRLSVTSGRDRERIDATARAVIECAADAIIAMIKQTAAGTTYYYAGYWYGRLIVDLPKSTAGKFEELLPTLPDKMVDQLLDSVMALKNKPD